MAYLETKDLTVGYHGKPLIEDIALHVQRGRIVTLIGPNGSGKSTILKTIIGQLSKVSGTVFLDGKAMEAHSRNEIARRMAILMTARMEPELMTCPFSKLFEIWFNRISIALFFSIVHNQL